MKTKKKAVKRKLSYGLSMECGEEDVSKKHCPISSNVWSDGNTSNIRNNFLQVSDKGNKFGCHTDLVPHTLSYTDEYGDGQKLWKNSEVQKEKYQHFEAEYQSQGTSSNSNCEERHLLSQKLKDIYNRSTKLQEQKHTSQAKSVPDTDTFKQHTYQILQPKDARRHNARANVDSSVNKGKGPYVFRVTGLIYHWIGSMRPDERQALRFLQLYIHDTANEVNNRMANFGDEHESPLKKEIVEGLIQLLDSHNALVQLFYTARNKYMEADIPEFKVRLYNVIGTRQYELPTAKTIGAIVFAKTSGIYDAILRGDRDANNLGLRTVLTASFTGSPRYMYAHYLDALAICRVHGSPSFFITFTCNAKWHEIEEFMEPFPQLTTADRADIVDRMFEKKVRDYIAFVRDSNTFGNVTAARPSTLPSLLWIDTTSKVKQAIDVDLYVSAELPDPKVDANRHRIISELMIHGPCGYANRNASCMKDESRCNHFGLPTPPQDMLPILRNRLLMEETNYNPEKLIFIYGHGGTGKTFLWKAITTALRSKEKIVLAVASSDESTCHIKKNSQLADLLRRTNLIIWDEAPMNDRRCFEALDRCLRDILDSPHTLFGGCSIMLGGDFRQTLPVKKKASKPKIIDASITSSYLWEEFKVYTLTQNMRLYQSDLTEAQKQCLYQFSTWLLDIGDGNIGTPDESGTKDIFNVHIPIHLCISDSDMALTELINFIYDDMALQTSTVEDLQKKAIVAPTNESADMINAHVLSLVNHQQRIYLSSDEAIPHGNDGGETELLYPAEYLNSLNFSGFPPHMLQLKIGAPIILLRNLNIAACLCNRTRLIVTQLLDKVIEARIITRTRTKMTEPSNPAPNQIDKGKLPLVEATTVSIADIKPAQVDQAIELKALISMHMKKCQSQSSLPLVQLGQQNATEINATSATYYYLNPEIPETSHILNVTQSEEQMRNRHTIKSLLNVNPQHYEAKPGRPNFTLNAVLKLSTQPLLALPEPESTNSPAAKILEESSTTTYPPSTTEGHLPTATTKDNVTEAAKDLGKKKKANATSPNHFLLFKHRFVMATKVDNDSGLICSFRPVYYERSIFYGVG
nr:DNA helicase [Tanacetum cinerariifolium]